METLITLREEQGKSRQEIAAALGVAYSTYSNYEQGIRRLSLEQVLKLSKIFNVSAEEIIKSQINSCRNAR